MNDLYHLHTKFHDFLNFQLNRLNVHVSGIFIFKNFMYRYLFAKRLTTCSIVKH